MASPPSFARALSAIASGAAMATAALMAAVLALSVAEADTLAVSELDRVLYRFFLRVFAMFTLVYFLAAWAVGRRVARPRHSLQVGAAVLGVALGLWVTLSIGGDYTAAPLTAAAALIGPPLALVAALVSGTEAMIRVGRLAGATAPSTSGLQTDAPRQRPLA